MAQQIKHTPLQWVKRMSTRQIGTFEICTAEPEPTTIALLPCNKEKNFGGHATKDEAEANAEMIVKAVNNHDKLVDMLKLVLKEKYRESNGSIQNTEIETMAEQLLQSLKD